MRKKVFGRHLSRGGGSRKALFRGLIRYLVEYGKITTTKAKAKAIVAEVDKIMGLVTQNSLSSRRAVLAKLGNDKKTMERLFSDYLPVSQKRNSGYTRIINQPARRGDRASIVTMEFIDKPEIKKPEVKVNQKAKKALKIVKKEPKKEKNEKNVPTKK